MDPIYLDNAATTPADPSIVEAYRSAVEQNFGNPSSRHPLGVRAAEDVARARRQVARVLGARPDHVVFTAGGTEANNLGVLGAARARRGEATRVLVGATEHASVRQSALALEREGFQTEFLKLDDRGELDLADAEARLGPDVAVVSHMLVNNEVGTRYDIERLAALVRRLAPKAHVHIDAVQSLGKVELSLHEFGVDSLSVSGHKVHAPKGVGAFACVSGARIERVVHGGGQEGGHRAGTENVPGIVALGAAAAMADEARAAFGESSRAIREVVEARLAEIPGARRLAPGTTVDAILALQLPGPPAEVWQHHLEARGVYVGVGAACQSMSSSISPALAALGLDEDDARRVVRLSLSRRSTPEEVDRAMDTLVALHAELGELAG